MRYVSLSILLLLPFFALSQDDVISSIKKSIEQNQYEKADQLISLNLTRSKKDNTINKSALWYYKGRLLSQQYFEKANGPEVNDELYKEYSYTLSESIAAFQNASRVNSDPTYVDMALRQIGGLHRFLKNLGIRYYIEDNFERAYLNLRWARNCDKYIQKSLKDNEGFEMDTMLIYLTIYTGELTNRVYESKSLYEELALNGVGQDEMYVHNFVMLVGLDKPNEAESILRQGMSRYPLSKTMVMHLLHWLNSNDRYQEVIDLVDQKIAIMPSGTTAKLFFIKGMAWNSIYDEALAEHHRDTPIYFKNAEDAYKNALSLSPGSFDYTYNLAALYYNKALQLGSENKTLPSHDELEYARMIQQAERTLETTRLLDATDTKVIGALEDIYRRTNQPQKLLRLQNPKG